MVWCAVLCSGAGRAVRCGAVRCGVMLPLHHRFAFSQLLELLHSHRLDILVDLNGNSEGGMEKALALRPVALQVNYLGFPFTLSGKYIDYSIADTVVVPPSTYDLDACCGAADPDAAPDDFGRLGAGEKLILMPESYMVLSHTLAPVYEPPAVTRAEFGLPEEGLIMCNFNQVPDPTVDRFSDVGRGGRAERQRQADPAGQSGADVPLASGSETGSQWESAPSTATQ